jgi:hypothetical protein
VADRTAIFMTIASTLVAFLLIAAMLLFPSPFLAG